MHKPAREIEKSLSTVGYRLTRPRRAVIKVLVQARRSLSLDEILIRARKLEPRIGLATVYRTLEMLTAEGHLEEVRTRTKRYMLACSNFSLHFHLVCERCQTVTELPSTPETQSLTAALQMRNFEPCGSAVEILGLCERCRNRGASETKPVHLRSSPPHVSEIPHNQSGLSKK